VNSHQQDSPASLVEQAVTLYRANDFQAAEQACVQYLAARAEDPHMLHILGLCRLSLGKTAEAVDALKSAAALAPDDNGILKSLARGQFDNRDLRDYCQSVLQLFARGDCSADNCVRAVQVMHRLGDRDGAVNHAGNFLHRYPDNPHLYNLYSVALKNVGRLPESIRAGRQGLALCLARPFKPRQLKKRPLFATEDNLRVLWNVLAGLNSAGIAAFPTAGTLLGLVRENRLLPGDKDLDLAVPFPDMDKCIAALARDGWRDVGGSYSLSNPRQLFHPDHNLYLDLCGLLREESGQTISGFWMEGIPGEWNRITEFPDVDLQQIDSPAGKIYWPTNPEAWLVALYGEGWRTPDHQFDTVICARNLRSFSLLVECYALNRIFAGWWAGDEAACLKIIRSVLAHVPDDDLYNRIRKALEKDTGNDLKNRVEQRSTNSPST